MNIILIFFNYLKMKPFLACEPYKNRPWAEFGSWAIVCQPLLYMNDWFSIPATHQNWVLGALKWPKHLGSVPRDYDVTGLRC